MKFPCINPIGDPPVKDEEKERKNTNSTAKQAAETVNLTQFYPTSRRQRIGLIWLLVCFHFHFTFGTQSVKKTTQQSNKLPKNQEKRHEMMK